MSPYPSHALTVPAISSGSRERVQRALVRKTIAPEPTAINHVGIQVLEREDPVLQWLAQSDEREYSKMFQTDTAISAATEQRVRGLLGAGDEVVPGNSGAAAGILRDFAVGFLKRVPRWQAGRAGMQKAIYWGWRPVELRWTTGGPTAGAGVLPEFRFNGDPKAYVYDLRVRDPWNFQFTVDQALVWVPPTGGDPVVFDSPADRLRWLVCTAGDTASPYGEGWYRRMWLLYFLKRQYTKMSADAMKRSLGLIRMKWRGGGSVGSTQPTADEALQTELTTLIDRVTSSGIMIETANWTFDFVDSIDFSSSHREMLELFDTQERLAIVGQNLTSEIRGQGSRAAAEVHETVLESFQRADAHEEAGWVNDGLLRPACELNFPDPDPDDLPRFRSKLLSKPRLSDLRTFYDMGGALDADAVASSLNVPIASEDTARVLQRSASDPELSIDESSEGARGGRGQAALVSPQQSDVDAVLDAATRAARDRAAGELERYYGAIAEDVLAANPGPQ